MTDSAKKRFSLRGFLLFVALVALGVFVFIQLVQARPEPKKHVEASKPVIVDVERVTTASGPVVVTAMGTVVPARSVTVLPEVGGKLVSQSAKLMPGGRFQAGETLAQIDDRDYKLAMQQLRAAVSQAKLRLAEEGGRKKVAEKEWALLGEELGGSAEGRKLALREVQLDNVKVAVQAARAQLRAAELQKERTTLKAPFNAVVLEEFVDEGQVVGPATVVAKLADSDRFWVRVSVPTDRLKWLMIPGVNATEGSSARVIVRLGGEDTAEYAGQVVQLLADLDPKGMMARVLVEVPQPLVVSGPDALPLFLGAYARVEITGRPLDGLLAVPRTALRGDRHVWVMADDDTLQIREVKVVWSDLERAYVEDGLAAEERVITSRIAVPVSGMPVRLNGNGRASERAAMHDAKESAEGQPQREETEEPL